MLAHHNSWKNVLMEIQCAMPVKAVETYPKNVFSQS